MFEENEKGTRHTRDMIDVHRPEGGGKSTGGTGGPEKEQEEEEERGNADSQGKAKKNKKIEFR